MSELTQTHDRNREPMCSQVGHVYIGGDMTCDCGMRSRSISVGHGNAVDLRVNGPKPPDVAALLALVEHWRHQGRALDAFHATMGTGYHQCADELAKLLAAGGRDG